MPRMSAASFASWAGISAIRGSALLDRQAHRVAPLGPRTVVVTDLRVAEQVGEHEPGVARALADPAVGNHVVLLLETDLAFVDRLEIGRALERAVLGIDRARPRNALRAGDVSAAQHAFLRVLRHVRLLAREL